MTAIASLVFAAATLFLSKGETVRTDCFRGLDGRIPSRVAWAEVTRTDDALKVWIGRRAAKGERICARGTANPPESMFLGGGEVVELALTPCADGSQPYYHVIVNPSNVVYKTRRLDATWTPTVPLETRPVFAEDRWGVELTIPYSALDVGCPKDGDVWRANFMVLADRWTGGANCIHDPQQYGTLIFGTGPVSTVVESATFGDDGRFHVSFAVPIGPQDGEIPHKVGGDVCNLVLSDGDRRLASFDGCFPDTPAADFVMDRFYYPSDRRLTMTYAVKYFEMANVRIRRLSDDAIVGSYPDVRGAGTLEVGPLAVGEYAFEISNGRFSAARQFEVRATDATVDAKGPHYPIIGSEKVPSAYLSFKNALPKRFTRKEATGYVFDPSRALYGAEELLKDESDASVLYRLAYEAQMAVMLGDAKVVAEHVADRPGFYQDAYRRLKARFPDLRFSIHVDSPKQAAAFAKACDVFEYTAAKCSFAHNMLRDMKDAMDKTLEIANGKPVVLWLGAAFPDNAKWRTADELNTAIRYGILRGTVGNVYHMGHGGVPESNTRLWSFLRGSEAAVNGWYPLWAQGRDAKLVAEAGSGIEYGYRVTADGRSVLLVVNLAMTTRKLTYEDPSTGVRRVLTLPGGGSVVLVK